MENLSKSIVKPPSYLAIRVREREKISRKKINYKKNVDRIDSIELCLCAGVTRCHLESNLIVQEEMNHVVRQIASSLHKKQINESDVDEDLIEKCLYTRHSPALDLLIRTSGEVRLSDFLLWQSSYTTIYFSKVLWPEFSLKDLCLAILHYQKNVPMIQVSDILSINVFIGVSLRSLCCPGGPENKKSETSKGPSRSGPCQTLPRRNGAPGLSIQKRLVIWIFPKFVYCSPPFVSPVKHRIN